MATMNPFDVAMEMPQDSKFKKYGGTLRQALLASRLANSEVQVPFHWYQVEAVLNARKLAMRDEEHEIEEIPTDSKTKPILIVAPTGAGKSGIIVMLPYVLDSAKVLVLTPSKVISEQLRGDFGPSRRKQCFFEKTGYCEDYSKLQNFLELVQVVESSEEVLNPDRLGNLVIVNAQKFGGKSKTSLVHKNKKIVEDVEAFFACFDTLIVDEAHHYPAKTWDKIVTEFSKPVKGLLKKIIFLTATPYRKNPSGGVTYIWEHIYGGKERIAIEITPTDVEGKTTRACEFLESREEMTTSQVATDVSWLLECHHNRERRFRPQAMILVRKINDARDLARELNKIHGENFAVAVLGSDSSPGKRNNERTPLEKFTDGVYRVAITCGVALEGYDNKNVTLCVILRKIVNGRLLFSQFIGRCKRMHLNLRGNVPDRTVSTIFSYAEFQQQRMWDDRKSISDNDPVEVDDDKNQ